MPPDANVRVHRNISSRHRYSSLSREEQLASSAKPASGVLVGADRIILVEDDDSDIPIKTMRRPSRRSTGRGDSDDENGEGTRDSEFSDENQPIPKLISLTTLHRPR